MSTFDSILKSEIRRLAKQEAKKMIQPLIKEIRDLKRLVRVLNKNQTRTAIKPKIKEGKTPANVTPEFIKKMREDSGLSQTAFGKLFNVGQFSISLWETGRGRPSKTNINKILKMSKDLADPPVEKSISSSEVTPAFIKSVRVNAGLSQKAFGEQLNTNQNLVCYWETGRTKPGIASIAKIIKLSKKLAKMPDKISSSSTELTPVFIKGVRKRAGLSQEAFAEQVNVSQRQVSSWENGTYKPGKDKIKKILAIHESSSKSTDKNINKSSKNILDIKKIRKSAGITQMELAKKLKVGRSTVYQWEAGKIIPRPAQAELILALCKTDIENADPSPDSEDSASVLINKARKKFGLSQRELAELINVTQNKVHRWESGKSTPSPEIVAMILALE